MPATFVGNTRLGNGQTTTASSLSGTISAAVGDYAVIEVVATSDASTLTTPSGWTLLSGPDRVSTTGTTWLLGRTLASTSTSVTLTLDTARRCQALATVYAGVNAAARSLVKLVESTAANPTTLPSAGSVPANAVVHVAWARRYGGTPAPDVTPPGAYSQGSNGRTATAYGTQPELSVESAYLIAPSTGTYGGESATVSSSSTGTNYLLVLPESTATSDVTVTGVAAQASLSASPGAPQGGSVTIEGAPAIATLRALPGTLNGADVPVEDRTLVWPPDPFRQAIVSGLSIWYRVSATLDGEELFSELAPTGGTHTDTTKPGVRRSVDLQFADADGSLYRELSVPGVRLKVSARLRFTSRQVMDLPMGEFVPDSSSLAVAGGALSMSAPDKWVLIQRARFLRPQASSRGSKVTDQIATLIRGALGSSEPVKVTATSTATMGALTWERDRDQAIIDLAKQIGAWVFFDRDGIATIADLPTVGASADWLLLGEGAGAVVTGLDRQTSRADTRNVVVVSSSAADRAKFAPQYVWDNDPASPTYAGPGGPSANPPSPNTAGPFGLVPFFFASPILVSTAQAHIAGRSILARVSGLAQQVSLESVPNPALDAFSVIDVLPPGRTPVGVEFVGDGGTIPLVKYRVTQSMERHIADTVTTPLTGGAQRIEGRSTRTEELEESS